MDRDTWWGLAVGGLLIGLPLVVWPGPIARWNRRTSARWGWRVPAEGSDGAFVWGGKYLRVLGAIALIAGIVCAVVAATRSS